MYAGINSGSVYQSSIQKSSFQNRSFQNTKDFANSSLGPTMSAKRANPALYSNNQIQSLGPPPPPPLNTPLDGGIFLILGGIVIAGYRLYYIKREKE
jgi:hypothetical protein